MKNLGRMSLRRPPKLLALLTAVVAITGATATWLEYEPDFRITAEYRSAPGLYVGDRVTILGVPVGEVTAIRPGPDSVAVEFEFDGTHPVPADARAVIVAPTLVTGRYIQLVPAYTGGPRLSDGATIPMERTAAPIEFDETKKQLVELSREIGPGGAEEAGALNSFLDATAVTVGGNGQALNTALTNLSDAARTLDAGGADLFATVENLQTVTTAVAAVDDHVRRFATELASVSNMLSGNRTELDALLVSMQQTFATVTAFLDENRDALSTNTADAARLTRLLVDRIDTLAQILHAGPTALSDFYNIYDPDSNSLTGALAIPDAIDPQSLICALLTTVDAPTGECARATEALAGQLAAAALPAPQGPAPTPAAQGIMIPGLQDIFTPGGHR
ncbi:MCE family protein [Nocardia higoensis]|uniref:MCE family protein n=1 Tax=Nocardia higoensis TaxID=228599 RepID=UPI000A06EE22|nr:MCE family protein [Nocardia higoensis]